MNRPINQGLAWSACLIALLGVAHAKAQVPPGKAAPGRTAATRARSAFNLFAAGATGVRLTANRVDCNGLTDFGNHCTDPSGSGTVEAGYWPAGTPDNYVFNGGLQVAAVVASDAGFAWAGDTVGVYFFDARGDQRSGTRVSGIFDSRNANDLASWPAAAYATDTSLFNQMLIGRAAVSDQDTWARYWDGDPSLAFYYRKHAMGLVVDQRTMAWSRALHQDIVYFTFRMINVTSRLASSYAGLASFGYSAAERQALATLGAAFQDSAKGRDATLQIPQGGFTFRNLYAAYGQDPDIGNATFNYSTAVLPFALVAAMKSNYVEPAFVFSASVFNPPFAAAPGFEAIQFLRSIPDSAGRQPGIAVWGNLCGGCGLLNDPIGTSQLYRYLSGHLSRPQGDGTCNSDPIALHTCAALQAYADTRFFESTGPTDLGPGQSLLIAVAMLYAAPVAAQPATINGIYAMPAFSMAAYQGSNQQATFLPGWPATAETLAVVGTGGGARLCTTACNLSGTVREPVERAMGWGQFSDVNGDGRIEPGEVQTVPGSLLHKAQAARALFDAKFLMPAAPEAPAFFLVPGDGRVTIAWQKSATETAGDPYYSVAQNPLAPDGSVNPLYDPDFRRFDVQGYRIWRGTSASDLAVIAEFDVAGATFTDYTGQVWDPGVYGNQCAPEIGVTTSCPAFPVSYALPGYYPNVEVIQIPLGGRALLGNGNLAVLQSDTAFTSKAGVWNWGVPYVFTDTTVRNGFPYVYAVTAFDVNSVRSGPSSLESPLATKSVTPRVGSGQESGGTIGALEYVGADGKVVPVGAMPTLDWNTGIFTGPMPPTDGVGIGFLSLLPQVVGTDSFTLAIDSVVPADGWNAVPGDYFVTVHSATGTRQQRISFTVSLFGELDSTGLTFPAAYAVQGKVSAYGGDSTFALLGQMYLRSPGTWDLTNWGRGSANSYPSTTNFGYNGPVWWDGTANDTAVNPHAGKCHPSCFGGPFTNSAGVTAGKLTGVQVMHIEAYETVQSAPMRQLHAMLAYVARAADMKVYWGTAGNVDSVIDATHHVRVPFNSVIRASWGILTDSSFTNTAAASTPDANNGLLTWADVFCIAPGPAIVGQCAGTTPAFLMDHARLSPVAFGGSLFAGAAALTATGNGFIFYIAGQYFVMQMAALPAAGTVWNLRTYSGTIMGSPGFFSFWAQHRPPAVPGLRLRVAYTGSVVDPRATNVAELATVHTVPDPYYFGSAFEATISDRQLRFVHLPAQCIVRIYSTSGILVRVLTHNDPTGGGEEPWDLRTREGLLAASGVYFYHVETPDRHTRVGRFTILNRGP